MSRYKTVHIEEVFFLLTNARKFISVIFMFRYFKISEELLYFNNFFVFDRLLGLIKAQRFANSCSMKPTFTTIMPTFPSEYLRGDNIEFLTLQGKGNDCRECN